MADSKQAPLDAEAAAKAAFASVQAKNVSRDCGVLRSSVKGLQLPAIMVSFA